MPTSNAIVAAKLANGTYKELEEGLSGGCDDRGEWETKCYLTAWSDRSNFMRDLKGLSRVSGGIGGTWSTVLPYQLPDNGSLYVRDITFVPEGSLIPGSNPIAFTHARFTVTFRKPEFNYQDSDDPGFYNSLSQDPAENEALLYATQELGFGKEWISIPQASVKFKSDGKVPNTPASRSISIITMVITWHRHPVMPMSLFRTYADCLNDKVFLGCAKGTVLFEGPETIREATTDGKVTQKIKMTFKWRERDWNRRLRDDAISWDFVVDKSYAGGPTGDSDASMTFGYRDFSKLLLYSTRGG